MSECTHHWTVTSECPFCLRQEIERLRQELAVEKGWVQQYRDSYGKYAADIAKQQIEIERLRSALIELRLRLHAAGRRPEECHEMSLIDEALSHD
jgi:hypothetical protein